MSQVKHTPGPWTLHDRDIQGVDVCAPLPNWGTTPSRIAAVVPHPVFCEANARLIAAAPEMLEALKKLASYSKDIMAGLINYRPEDHIQVAEAAIKKAEGQ